jgi:hypothetical protein
MASKKQDVSSLEFTGMELLSNPPQYVYKGKDGSRVVSRTVPTDDQMKGQSKSIKKLFEGMGNLEEVMMELGGKKARGQMKKKAPGKMRGGAMKAKGMKKGGAMKTKGMRKGGAMKSKGYAKGGALTKEEARSLRKKSGAAVTKKEIEEMKIRKKTGAATTKKELDKMKKTSGKKRGGAMKAKGMAKGGMMKTKGMAKGGMMKAKGMAKGGAMKTKGGNKGGVKRNMRPPSSKKSGLYGR